MTYTGTKMRRSLFDHTISVREAGTILKDFVCEQQIVALKVPYINSSFSTSLVILLEWCCTVWYHTLKMQWNIRK
jgi:hypothetical protein